MFKIRRGLLFLILIFLITGGYKHFSFLEEWLQKDHQTQTQDIRLTDQRRVHILYGDKTGGGHMHGVGKPCKTEFPKDWDAQEVIQNVKAIAANDNLNWKKQSNGYYVAEQAMNGVTIKVVLSREKDSIITAYPVDTPKNDCPVRRPANDNFNP